MIAAWLWVQKHWRLAVMVAASAVVVALWAYAAHLRHVAQDQKARAQAAVQQARVQVVATKAADNVATTITKVEEHTRVVVRTIQAAPGSDAAVPGDVLAAWRGGLSDGDADPPR